jgi:hypothetical protein
MAYSDNIVVSRLGEKQGGAADPLELFLKEFAGMVLTEFDDANKLMPFVTKRTLRGAKSAQFPVIGKVAGKYFTAGDNLLDDTNGYLQAVPHTEKIIYADKKLIAGPVAIDEWDAMINHYEVSSEYSHQLGEKLGVEMDFNILKILNVASFASANLTGGFGGLRIETNDETAAQIKLGLAAAAQAFDERFIPPGDRIAVLSPAAYYALLLDKEVIHGDYNGRSNGDLAGGRFYQYLGLNIVSSAHLGSATFRANHTSVLNQPNGTGTGNVYVTNATNTKAFVFHPSAIGLAKTQDLTFESKYYMEFQADLMLAKLTMGLGVLRPECVAALANDA